MRYFVGAGLICLMSGCSTMHSDYTDMSSRYFPSGDVTQEYTMPQDEAMNYRENSKYATAVAPTRPKDSDLNWMSAQPAENYTVELSRSMQASEVAKVLYRAPKTERMGEISTSNGYVGVFGSFHSQEAAMSAVEQLPEPLRKGARIVQWRDIQISRQ